MTLAGGPCFFLAPAVMLLLRLRDLGTAGSMATWIVRNRLPSFRPGAAPSCRGIGSEIGLLPNAGHWATNSKRQLARRTHTSLPRRDDLHALQREDRLQRAPALRDAGVS